MSRTLDTPAYPVNSETGLLYFGLTKREYFAAIALQGILAYNGRYDDYKGVAKNAFIAADAMIAASGN